MPSSTDKSPPQNISRQEALTSLLLGADFLPCHARPPRAVSSATVEVKPAAAPELSAEQTSSSSDPAARLAAALQRYEAEFPHDVIDTPHTRIVWGEGDPAASLMFIGEAPGADEDRTGRPFVGRAGQKLTEIITAMGLSREQVYITNILKVRPPENRTPLKHEVEATWPFLAEQIRIINPKAIVTLGGPATKLILNTDTGITRLRGIWAEYRDPETSLTVPVMPTFHPAYLLRQYTVENRQKVWSDMLAALDKLGLPRPA